MYFIFIKNTFKSQCVEDKLSLKVNIRCNTKQEKRQLEREKCTYKMHYNCTLKKFIFKTLLRIVKSNAERERSLKERVITTH